MGHKIEQLEAVQADSYEKDLGWDPECGPMITVRVYQDTKVKVPDALLNDSTFEPVGLFCHRHSLRVNPKSTLHNLLAEMFPNHKGWGYFGLISKEDNVLHLEWRGY